MIDNHEDPPDILFESVGRHRQQKRKLKELGFQCDPCDPLLPLHQPRAFYGEENQPYQELIVKIIEFIEESPSDLLFLKGPRGTGKTIFARIFEEYCQKLNISAVYQDASTFFSESALDPNDTLHFSSNMDSGNVIFLDNAFHLHKTLPRLLSLKSPSTSRSPKIIAIMDSTEFEIYCRLCIQRGDTTYQHFVPMPHFSQSDINNLLKRRLQVCFREQKIPQITDKTISNIATLALGNPGVAIRILEDFFSLGSEGLRFTFGIDTKVLGNFPQSKIPILGEILVREIQNEFLPREKREYIIHKKLTSLMNKTKSTISHHLGDLLSSNLIYEQSTDRDKREKAYRPNKAIFGILEYLTFESTIMEDTLLNFEGINHEE